jgi:hypothetical protein
LSNTLYFIDISYSKEIGMSFAKDMREDKRLVLACNEITENCSYEKDPSDIYRDLFAVFG